MGWEMVKLGDVCRPVTSKWRDSTEQYFYYLDIGAIDAETKRVIKLKRVFKDDAPSRAKFLLSDNDVVVSTVRPALNTVTIIENAGQSTHPLVGSSGFSVLRTNEEVLNPTFLFHFVRTTPFIRTLSQLATGASYPAVSDKIVKNVKIPLPPLEEQQRIATILGTVEKAIRAEEQSISRLEALTKNLAPETNRTVPIGEYVGRIVSGKSIKEHSTPGGPRVLKISSTTSGYFKPEESKPLDPSYEPPEHHRVQEGDLLVSRANTTELVGASAIVDQPYENLLLPDKLWRLVTKDSVDPFFLWACLQHPLTRNAISKASSGSGGSMKNISQTNFLAVEIPDVDATVQTTIGNQVRAAFHQRALRSSKLTLLRELYASVSSRAFAGEL